jgi:hypothetical protein
MYMTGIALVAAKGSLVWIILPLIHNEGTVLPHAQGGAKWDYFTSSRSPKTTLGYALVVGSFCGFRCQLTYDKYIIARLWLPDGEGILQHATVKKRKRDEDENLIGKSNPNPILDTALYMVGFDDGTTGMYVANVIAENIFEQVDAKGQLYKLR